MLQFDFFTFLTLSLLYIALKHKLWFLRSSYNWLIWRECIKPKDTKQFAEVNHKSYFNKLIWLFIKSSLTSYHILRTILASHLALKTTKQKPYWEYIFILTWRLKKRRLES